MGRAHLAEQEGTRDLLKLHLVLWNPGCHGHNLVLLVGLEAIWANTHFTCERKLRLGLIVHA